MIQNASDAVRVRRFLENRAEEYGEITIRLGEDNRGHWLEVEDNGIGMSSDVLIRYLLDFGTSYWGSNLMTEELPGLLASGVRLTGKYGIGFFSLFMLGDAIRVRTRRSDAARNATIVLEFNTGLSVRPILRPASEDELIRDGGTCIRVWLQKSPVEEGGLLWKSRGRVYESLASLCGVVAPSLDVNIKAESGTESVSVVTHSDWMSMDGRKLLERLGPLDAGWTKKPDSKTISRAAKDLRIIKNSDGEIVGRACLTIHPLGRGALTVGGLFSNELISIGGILTGIPERAARDLAMPSVELKPIRTWATEQARLVSRRYRNTVRQMNCAEIVRHLGGHTENLPIAIWEGKPVSYHDIITNKAIPDELLFVSSFQIEDFLKIDGFVTEPNVVIVDYDGRSTIISGEGWSDWPANLFSRCGIEEPSIHWTLGGAFIDALAERWNSTASEILLASEYDPNAYRTDALFGYIDGKKVEGDGLSILKP